MYRVMICDDEEKDLLEIREMVENYQKKRAGEVPRMEFFSSPSADRLGQSLLEGMRYDIYFLDIMMDGPEGLRIGEQIREMDDSAMIVFVTSSPDYALQAFGVFASAYLQKPVSPDQLEVCMDRLLLRMRPMGRRLFSIKSRDGMIQAEFGQITRVENVSRTMHFHMADGQVYTSVYIRQSFEVQLEELLLDGRFIQPHKSFVINMDYIEKVMPHDFVMTDGTMIPISRNNTSAKKQYLEYLSRAAR